MADTLTPFSKLINITSHKFPHCNTNILQPLPQRLLRSGENTARHASGQRVFDLTSPARPIPNEALGAVLVMKRMTGAIIDLGRARQAL
ncbi:hypothetical protein FOXG_18733 [Fusarium oxysporum f. sp. lycopersici 4287]|uniref:Uncharacterized protein n=2 Tax=Fusarium oxysporum TaxID=5507 RepID=A0A0J9UNM7_FUSO4|nr:hypothetical protein FOXG_18733 [Fusarium oxysporum f. sp. lycopersici 4287]EXK44399.1 hypothetical protein FOMG_03130 [Fusarium oxysporum f. sp. melonis 26406]KNB00538.1 hypothetical protein FOXG_18733 [Fusarium oxysporum f. sp. lycopersici 4287]